ncbi:MAG: hypothetical protein WA604_08005, partial [Candidatus Sulfotelmatobacter sp.]
QFCNGVLRRGRRLLQPHQLGRASQYYTKAFELRQHANDRSKLMTTGNYYSTVTGEHDKAARTFHEMIETYGNSISGRIRIAGGGGLVQVWKRLWKGLGVRNSPARAVSGPD